MPWYALVVDDRERAIEAIAKRARETRAQSSRTFWIAALLVGAIGVAAFVAVLLVDHGSSSASSAPAHESGFATGAAIGLAAGVAIGYALARRKR